MTSTPRGFGGIADDCETPAHSSPPHLPLNLRRSAALFAVQPPTSPPPPRKSRRRRRCFLPLRFVALLLIIILLLVLPPPLAAARAVPEVAAAFTWSARPLSRRPEAAVPTGYRGGGIDDDVCPCGVRGLGLGIGPRPRPPPHRRRQLRPFAVLAAALGEEGQGSGTTPPNLLGGDDDDEVVVVNGEEGDVEGEGDEEENPLLFGRVARLLEAMPMAMQKFPPPSSSRPPLYVERRRGRNSSSSNDARRNETANGAPPGGRGGGAASVSAINLKLVRCGQAFAATAANGMEAATARMTHEHSEGSSTLPPGLSPSADSESEWSSRDPPVLVSALTKVPGCVATVRVRTTLVPNDPPQTSQPPTGKAEAKAKSSASRSNSVTGPSRRYGVVLDGTADAALSRGLLSLLSASLGPDISSLRRTFGGGIALPDGLRYSGGAEGVAEDKPWFPTAGDVLGIDRDRAAEKLGLRHVLSRGRNDGVASLVGVVQDQIRSLLSSSSEPPQAANTTTSDDAATIEDTADTRPADTTANTAATTIEDTTDTIAITEAKANGITTKGGKKKKKKKVRVAVLLSGGVDSSVALALLASDPTYDVTAFYLRIWLEDELSHLGECPWEDDWEMCQRVCEYVGGHVSASTGGVPIPLEAVSMQEEYVDAVLGYTLAEARRGRTPNPDVWCNARIKFGCFYDAVSLRSRSSSDDEEDDGEDDEDEGGFDYVATGHYASVVPVTDGDGGGGGSGRVRLLRAPDPVKDQTYFLSALSQSQLSRAMFPLGNYTKAEVRELAQNFGLPNRDRPDSQGLCFLGKVRFEDFLGSYLGERMGDVVDADTGDVIGMHRGLWFHTVGQRKGLGKVLLPQRTAEGPWYVVAKDPGRNALFVSNRYNDQSNDIDGDGDGGGVGDDKDERDALAEARLDCHVEDIRWIAGSEPSHLFSGGNNFDGDGDDGGGDAECGGGRVVGRFSMKVRHGPTMVDGWLELLRSDDGLRDGDGDSGGGGVGGSCGRIKLDRRDGGLAPGQFVAFYEPNGGNECLGSAVISERHWVKFLASGSGALRYVGNAGSAQLGGVVFLGQWPDSSAGGSHQGWWQ